MRLIAVFLALAFIAATARADDALWAQLAKGGHLMLMRHGLTSPGVGDPPGFKLDDCTTQRNLIETGRAESRRAGAAVKARNVPIEEVRTSPWCRCVETARLAFATEPVVDTMLSNLFTDPQNREAQVASFRRFAATRPTGGNIVLVTHGATIAAFTGINPATAEMVIVAPDGKGAYSVAGRLPVPP